MRNFIFIMALLIVAPQLRAQTREEDSSKLISLDEIKIKSYYNSKELAGFNKKNHLERTEKLLESLPGISLISRGNFAQEPIIRGLSDGQIMTTIDGMKIFGACTDRMDPSTSYIEPNNLRNISLSNGPGFSAGGATIGGSINFNLKKAMIDVGQPLKISVGTGFQSNGLGRQLLGGAQYSKRRWAIFVNGIYRKADNYTTGGNRNELIKNLGEWSKDIGFSVDKKGRLLYSQYSKWNAGISAVFNINKNNSLNSDVILDRAKDVGYPALTMDVAFANATIASLSHEYKKENSIIRSLETKVYYNTINHAMDDTKRPSDQLFMHMDMPGQSHTMGFYTISNIALPHHQLNTRIEKYRNRWHADMTMYANGANFTMYMMTIPDAQRDVTGIDLQDNFHINQFLNTTAGLRAELNSSSIYTTKGLNQLSSIYNGNVARNNFLWNAYIQQQFIINPKIFMSLKLAKAMRAATLKELYAVYLFNRVDGYEYVGNPALKCENSLNTEITATYRSKIFESQLKIFSYFISNYIAGMVQSGQSPTMQSYGVKKYQNISAARIAGGEWMLLLRPFKNVSLISTNSFQNGVDDNKNALPLMSPFHTTNRIEWNVVKIFSLFGESVYAAPQKNVSTFYGEKMTPAFNIYNIGVEKNFNWKNKHLSLNLSGLNIFNCYYYEHVDVIKLPRPGRNIILNVALYF